MRTTIIKSIDTAHLIASPKQHNNSRCNVSADFKMVTHNHPLNEGRGNLEIAHKRGIQVDRKVEKFWVWGQKSKDNNQDDICHETTNSFHVSSVQMKDVMSKKMLDATVATSDIAFGDGMIRF